MCVNFTNILQAAFSHLPQFVFVFLVGAIKVKYENIKFKIGSIEKAKWGTKSEVSAKMCECYKEVGNFSVLT